MRLIGIILKNIYDADTIREIAKWYLKGDDFISVAQDESAAITWLERAVEFFNDAESKEILDATYRAFMEGIE